MLSYYEHHPVFLVQGEPNHAYARCMGRYVYGSAGFAYKYVFAAQPTNLNDLAAWDEFDDVERTVGLRSQFYGFHDDDAPYRFIDGVSWSQSVYEMTIDATSLEAKTGIVLGSDIEYAIYAISDHWQKAVLTIDELLPGPAVHPDLSRVGSVTLRRNAWDALATRIGHGARVGDRESLIAARQKVFDTGESEYLPLLAINALLHAIDHDLDALELVDGDPTQTNLWSCVEDFARQPSPDASFEDRYAYALFATFSFRKNAVELWSTLLDDHPESMPTTRNLFGRYLWDQDFEAMWKRADVLLADAKGERRAELLEWRGDAAFCLDRKDEAQRDAEEAAKLGRSTLAQQLAKADDDDD